MKTQNTASEVLPTFHYCKTCKYRDEDERDPESQCSACLDEGTFEGYAPRWEARDA